MPDIKLRLQRNRMGKWIKLVFKQNQPIHIGSVRWGVVNETEIFIPGSTMWGALTNLYLQVQAKADEVNFGKPEDLERVSSLFKEISNFYPCTDPEGKNILFPNYKKGSFYLGDISEDKFRHYLTDVIVQTAVEPVSRKAKDESLHEFEFILPQPKTYKKSDNLGFQNLYWVGVIRVEENKDNNSIKFLDRCIREKLPLFIGGDIKYGFGEVELIRKRELTKEETKREAKEWWINEGGNISIHEGEPSPYFIVLKHVDIKEGEIVIVPEIEFRKSTPTLRDALFCTSVGSRVKEKDSAFEFQLIKGKLTKPDSSSKTQT